MRLIAAALLTSMIAPALTMPLAAAENAKEEAKAKPKKERRVCRSGEPTGSRVVVRTCHTESEWAVLDRDAREHADREVDRAQAMATSGGSGFSPN